MKNQINPIIDLAENAGKIILEIYLSGFSVKIKSDKSPLTQADLAAHSHIVNGLSKLDPNIPIISEEDDLPDYNKRALWKRYWLIDPLDGTKEFINRNGEFSVNIALIDNNEPVLGVVHIPIKNKTYFGYKGHGAACKDKNGKVKFINVAKKASNPIKVLSSRSHKSLNLNEYLKGIGSYNLKKIGSSLKFCIIAEGKADLYPRFGKTSEWDTAAAQIIVEEAGGRVLTMHGNKLKYNKKNILNPDFFVIGATDKDWLALAHPWH